MMEWLDVIKEMSDEAQERMEEEERSDGSKHPWTKQEDELLKQLIEKNGAKEWSTLAMNVRPPAAHFALRCRQQRQLDREQRRQSVSLPAAVPAAAAVFASQTLPGEC